MNLPSPIKDEPARVVPPPRNPGEKGVENDKSGDGRSSPSISPSEPDGSASEADANNESAKVRDKDMETMKQRLKDMEAMLVQVNQEVAARDREEEFRARLLKDLTESQRLANAGAAGHAPSGSSNVLKTEAAHKEALPEKLDTFLLGDLTPMWINTTRGLLPQALKAILDNTLDRSRTTPDWDLIPEDEERKRKRADTDTPPSGPQPKVSPNTLRKLPKSKRPVRKKKKYIYQKGVRKLWKPKDG